MVTSLHLPLCLTYRFLRSRQHSSSFLKLRRFSSSVRRNWAAQVAELARNIITLNVRVVQISSVSLRHRVRSKDFCGARMPINTH